MVLNSIWEIDSIIYSMLQVLTVFIGQQTVVPQCITITTLLLLVAVDQFFWKIINWWRSLRMYGVYLHVLMVMPLFTLCIISSGVNGVGAV